MMRAALSKVKHLSKHWTYNTSPKIITGWHPQVPGGTVHDGWALSVSPLEEALTAYDAAFAGEARLEMAIPRRQARLLLQASGVRRCRILAPSVHRRMANAQG